MAADPNESPADSVVAGVYRGPVEDFVRRRDALAKELRSSGDRHGAAMVKGLRKPTRTAWALNLGVQENVGAIAALVDAVAAVLDAQATGVDVRSAISGMRTAVRELADVAARTAEQSGHSVESGVLTNAVLAVLGSPESFEQLRGGYLVDIPEAGGLDFLASLPAPVGASRPVPPKESEASASQTRSEQETGNDSAVRAAMQQAARVLAEARENSASAQRGLADAGTRVAAAEERLRRAEEEAREAQQLLERARSAADAAAAQLRAAEANAAETERRASASERS